VVKWSGLVADGGFVIQFEQEIVRFFEGFEVCARFADGSIAGVPDFLVASMMEIPFVWIDRILHQPNLADLDAATFWRASLEQPGVGVEFVTDLVDEDRVMRTSEMRYLNLVDNPIANAVLIGLRFGESLAAADRGPETNTGAPLTRASWTLLTMDLVGKVIEVSGDTEAIFGRPAADLVGCPTLSLIHPHDVDAVVLRWVDFVTTQAPVRSIHSRALRPDGTTVWVNIKLLARPSESLVLALIEDVSSRIESDEQLVAATASFASVVDLFQHPVFVALADGRISLSNSAFNLVAGQMTTVADLEGIGFDSDRWKDMCEYGLEYSQFVFGPDQTVSTRWRLTCHVAEGEGPSVVIGQMFDVTEEYRREQLLEDWANRDNLTGLLNRRGLEQRWQEFGASTGVAVLFLDVDGLKRTNDAYGHGVGDALLCEVALRLRSTLQPGDVLARIGGDEFVLATRTVAGDDASLDQLVRGLHFALEGPAMCDGQLVDISASIGWHVCVSSDHAPVLADALDHADRSMYREKRKRQDETNIIPTALAAGMSSSSAE
jgi:diguanylate cyclase (GGDEF)-like protein/PAS domain S-box-containing protein